MSEQVDSSLSDRVLQKSVLTKITEPKKVVDSILQKNLAFYTDPRGKGALRDLQQTFPHPWLYIAELLQNATDENATCISFTSTDNDGFIFEHNGRSLNGKDVRALCSRGVSTKGAGTVGFMGVGFKSVFRSFEKVEISSDPWKFSLTVPISEGSFGDLQRDWLGAVLPHWDEQNDSLSQGMTCRFSLSRRLPGLNSITSDLERVFGEENTLLALLAWRGVEEVQCNESRWLLSKKGQNGDSPILLEALDQSSGTIRRWIMFVSTYQPSRTAVGRFLEHRQLHPNEQEKEKVYAEASRQRQVAAFCEIDEQNNPLIPERGNAFAFLPIGITLPVGLHVQADWLLVVSRQEIMQVEGNEWHQEILEQIPRLLHNFLAWIVDNQSGKGWERGYNALPLSYRSDEDIDQWFNREEFSLLLKNELQDLRFLPVRSIDDQKLRFISPRESRTLPSALAKHFDNEFSYQTLLFGENVISRTLLGRRAFQFVSGLDLIEELAPDDLVNKWKDGLVGQWLNKFEESYREKRITTLLTCLAELDEREPWRKAELACLPTQSGTWGNRTGLTRLPGDWDALAQETEIHSAFEPFVGSSSTTLSWELDRAWTRSRSPALKYVDHMSVPKLEDIANSWWDSLPEKVSREQAQLILQFTSWVRVKQPQRKRIIRKVLTGSENGQLLLVKAEDSLLAEPYAESCRRHFFPAVPAVSELYAEFDSSGSLADWRSFFESLDPKPKGPFALRLTATAVSWRDLKEKLGDDYSPPPLRSSWYRTKWRGLDIDSNHYKLLDAQLPKVITDLFAHNGLSLEDAVSLCLWLSEAPGGLREYPFERLAFIAFGEGRVTERSLPQHASWIRELETNKWIPSKHSTTLYRPSDILPFDDPARPNAPVADIPAELLEILSKGGIEFGSALPDAPAIDRLRVQGPHADVDTLLELTEKAIEEASDDESRRTLLLRVFRELELFPRPSSSNTIDRQQRVTYDRLVRATSRSTLGDWIVAVERFKNDSFERKLLDRVHSFAPLPETTTAEQAMEFLAWVWQSEPEVDRLRGILPRAFQYLRDALKDDEDLLLRWAGLQQDAKVFITPQRKWVRITGNDQLFLDDLTEALPDTITPNLQLATAGHLGESLMDQLATADLLRLKTLSTRFQILVLPEDETVAPEHWQKGFAYAQERLMERIRAKDRSEDIDSSDAQADKERQPLQLSRWKTITTQVLDNGVIVSTGETRAAFIENTMGVSGLPADFAPDLCTLLCNRWRLRLRRDLADILPRLTVDLMSLGDPQVVSSWLPGTAESESNLQTQILINQGTGLSSSGTNLASSEELTIAIEENGSKSDHAADGTGEDNLELGDIASSEAPPIGYGHTARDREIRLSSMIKRRTELDRQINEMTTIGVVPPDCDSALAKGAGEFRSDDDYRTAVIEYERRINRWAVAKSANEEGHDIDSYTHDEGHPERQLIRRIEVKGKGVNWNGDEIVEMSDSQFRHALSVKTEEEDLPLHSDFDYWLYVVENNGSNLIVLPLRNPARRAARYEFRGGSWRNFSEAEDDC